MGLRRLRPGFWTAAEATGPYTGLFNYRRVWWLAVALLAAVSLIPLCIMTVIDFGVTKRSVNQENLHRTTITTSNTRHTLADFLTERLAALTFVASDAPYPALVNHDRLAAVLQNLKTGFGGFMDLGVIDDTGRQVAYIGPYPLLGIDYSGQDWFKQTARTGHCISDVFLGFRNAPHFIIAVRSELPDGHFFMLRATLDTQRINDILANLDLSGNGDAFLVNREGILQTVSRSHGTVFDHLPFSLPPLPPTTKVILTAERIIGCAPIDGTPLVLLVVKRQAALMQTWYAARLNLIGFLAASVVVILVVIMGVAAQMVEKIFLADQTRAKAMRQMELTNRMASIGRLAAGVAHEINNPLAIINEKAGLIKDLLLFGQAQCSNAEKLIGLVDSVIASVDRAGTITKRLLSFARHQDVRIEPVSLRQVIAEVMGFLTKEATYRNIAVDVTAPEDLPDLESDRGKLQQIFLNLVGNAFQAMNDGGHLQVRLSRPAPDWLAVDVADDGCGIPAGDLKHIFEPFFSTKQKKGGTGLGLSITYGLVQELGGRLEVASEPGQGATFTVRLPLKKGAADAHPAGG